MMGRPMVLAILLVLLIITSQFEFKQQLVSEIEASPSIGQKPHQVMGREEVIKEKIILSQEKNIQRLNELVQSLQRQLLQCRSNNKTTNGTGNSLTEKVNEYERQQIVED